MKRIGEALEQLRTVMLEIGDDGAAARLERVAALFAAGKGRVEERLEKIDALLSARAKGAADKAAQPPQSLTSILRLLTISRTSKVQGYEISAILRRLVEAGYQDPSLIAETPKALVDRLEGRREAEMGSAQATATPSLAEVEAQRFAAAAVDEESFAAAREALLARPDLSAQEKVDVLTALTGATKRQLSNAEKRLKALNGWWASKARAKNERRRLNQVLRGL